MAKVPRDLMNERRRQLISTLAEGPISFDAIQQELDPPPAVRTLRLDLKWLKQTFPGHLIQERVATDAGGKAVHYHWSGPEPFQLDPAIEWALQEEVAGLVMTRALLQQAQGSGAIGVGQLLDHPKLRGLAGVIAQNAVQVSNFGTEPTEAKVVSACMVAILTGQGLEIIYENRQSDVSIVIVRPLRMVLIRNEWYCLAWEKRLRSYRASRIQSARVIEEAPKCPASKTNGKAIDKYLSQAFYATFDSSKDEPVRVVLAISPDAWPQVKGREWGLKQWVDHHPKDLPAGWRRLSFKTAGLLECRYWILTMGSSVIAEGPVELVEWISDQVSKLHRHYCDLSNR